MFLNYSIMEIPDLRHRQIDVWRIAHDSSFRIVALYLAKILFVARRKIFSDAKRVEIATSTGSLFDRPKSFPMSAIDSRILSERQSFNLKVQVASRRRMDAVCNAKIQSKFNVIRRNNELSLFRCRKVCNAWSLLLAHGQEASQNFETTA